MTEFNITKRIEYECEIIDIEGDISDSNIDLIEAFINYKITFNKQHIIFNMKNVSYISNSALSLLEIIMQKLLMKKITIFIMNANSNVKGILEKTRIKQYFRFIENENILNDKLKKEDLENLLDPSNL